MLLSFTEDCRSSSLRAIYWRPGHTLVPPLSSICFGWSPGGLCKSCCCSPRESVGHLRPKFLQRRNHPMGVGGREHREGQGPSTAPHPHPLPVSGRQHPCLPLLLPFVENKAKRLRRAGNTEDERESMREKSSAKKEAVRGESRKKLAARDLHLTCLFNNQTTSPARCRWETVQHCPQTEPSVQ